MTYALRCRSSRLLVIQLHVAAGPLLLANRHLAPAVLQTKQTYGCTPTPQTPLRRPHPFPPNTIDFLANEKGVPRDKVKSWTPYPGGAPCNVATALSKLGIKTAFISAIGDDDRGDEIMKLLAGELLG